MVLKFFCKFEIVLKLKVPKNYMDITWIFKKLCVWGTANDLPWSTVFKSLVLLFSNNNPMLNKTLPYVYGYQTTFLFILKMIKFIIFCGFTNCLNFFLCDRLFLGNQTLKSLQNIFAKIGTNLSLHIFRYLLFLHFSHVI